jgi:hypothetical protein
MRLKFTRTIACSFFSALLLLLAGGNLAAQSAARTADEEKGYTLYEQFEGSSNTLGQVMKFDTSAGYNFSRFWGVDLGIPVYVVRASTSTSTTTTPVSSGNGIGDAHVDLRLTVNNPLLNFGSTLIGRAPTGSTSLGMSTGRATFEWDNHFDRSFLGLQPFANAGVANSISDTHFFVRPFTTLGMVALLEGGATYKVFHLASVGASLYADEPWGQQKVYSKLVSRTTLMVGSRRQPFANVAETVGSAALARDNGFSAWVGASPIPYLDLEVGYTRSVHYDLNTVSFGVGLNLGSLFKLAKHY